MDKTCRTLSKEKIDFLRKGPTNHCPTQSYKAFRQSVDEQAASNSNTKSFLRLQNYLHWMLEKRGRPGPLIYNIFIITYLSRKEETMTNTKNNAKQDEYNQNEWEGKHKNGYLNE